ncbi:IclR family transcriptional regulator [Actinoalloteichus hymeniacidonis]|uniref:Transcriptional regulator, IclR family n=1 Tax=Actinoalloteichus hymeniacidonis TaxID=340345 RepID=A0AAC9HRE2_9PSEU|nr:IclR family transcriptional regulator [Actinoalloteichus hymeniacidonis]AOS63939.1 transcriptional regulator, IclR family [Actinoalloteichus hymeniacidonis]MBB5908004.1 DNA-binding IclR family transcriptional regulator [Actinoalloteichus hymeniacidonis]
MVDGESRSGQLRTVDRALVVLSAFTDERPERGVVELARELGLDKSQVQRMLATLAGRGFLTVRPDTRRYRLGPALLGLGRRAERSMGLDGSISTVLHTLAHTFAHSAVFNVPDGSQYRCAAAVDFPGPIRYSSAIGELYPGHGGASGHAIFAQLPTERVRELFPGRLAALTRSTIGTVDALLHRHAQVRDRGVAISEGEYHPQVMAVAAPVFVAGGVVGSIGIAGAAEQMRERVDEITTAVVAAAAELTSRYRPDGSVRTP